MDNLTNIIKKYDGIGQLGENLFGKRKMEGNKKDLPLLTGPYPHKWNETIDPV
ncbi:hypothetical protein GCM10028804_50010 [Larkinella terrae]